jgi:hypothetical protein
MPTRSCSPKPKRKANPVKKCAVTKPKKTSSTPRKTTQSKKIVKIEGKKYSVKKVRGVYVIDKVA